MRSKRAPDSVKDQYEELPYPMRDPADERHRLIHGYGNNLIVLNHHCFEGNMDFRAGFRCLVAGGGTGDAVIYLAEQLRDFDAEIIYLDFSAAACQVAKERAKVRGLDNIRWIVGSILDIPNMDLGEIDFISCTGVLHHLESTEDGLAILTALLKDHGAIYLMLYGKFGRSAVYDMQALMRTYLPEDLGIRDKIAMARQLLGELPATNSFQRDLEKWEEEISPEGNGDAGLLDLLLHNIDRCFDVRELYELAASAGLYLQSFPVKSERYDPTGLVSSESISSHLRSMALPRQQAIAEMLRCDLIKHEFYLTRRENTVASLNNEDNGILLFWTMFRQHQTIAEKMIPGKTFTVTDGEHKIDIKCSETLKVMFTYMDGMTPLKKIYELARKAVPSASLKDVRQELMDIYSVLHPRDYVYLMSSGSYGIKLPDYSHFEQTNG
jgi:SAM-dependent methyltransferase